MKVGESVADGIQMTRRMIWSEMGDEVGLIMKQELSFKIIAMLRQNSKSKRKFVRSITYIISE